MEATTTPDPLPDAPVEPPISTRGIVIGLLIVALLLGGFVVWASTLAVESGRTGGGPPQLILLEPADGSTVAARVALVFEAPVELRRSPAGWESGGFHVHASIDGRELMPGSSDVERLPGNRYRWTLPPLPTGTREVRLFWSDARHREVAEGATPPITFEVR
jgi:hypothetical protein